MDQLLLRRRVSTVYPYLSAADLDRRVAVAEALMNEALDNRQWHLVRRRRQQMLGLQAERHRRLRNRPPLS